MNKDKYNDANLDKDEDDDSDKHSDNVEEGVKRRRRRRRRKRRSWRIYILDPCSILVKSMIERLINYALLKILKDKSA